jgi:hypothetical protein
MYVADRYGSGDVSLVELKHACGTKREVVPYGTNKSCLCVCRRYTSH